MNGRISASSTAQASFKASRPLCIASRAHLIAGMRVETVGVQERSTGAHLRARGAGGNESRPGPRAMHAARGEVRPGVPGTLGWPSGAIGDTGRDPKDPVRELSGADTQRP
ncbi:hypothetical protein NDU88_007951 [Pleurodeles waltl]|uniref:Uncharacterized protein n=1 Tax=Pleurodeles waltl TaxID=8319 RepID=A0AAV7VR59_PLEWA|nr:hypothetical protein NDU88_007951 [Pleurodeles waltl]